MRRIHSLSPQVANQIAAGEVIERPASILKELLENSLDAGATSISIQLQGVGITSIQITDNGHGILKEDLPLALQCHATSKICDFEDLTQLKTFGFRGEALASIAAVSHLTLTSRTDQQAEAWQITVSGKDQCPEQIPAAHPPGTTVLVEELFCQTPVRRKFLKSAKTELFHAEDTIKRLALAHPEVSFQYAYLGKTSLQLPGAKELPAYRKRVGRCFGQQWAKHALYFQEKATEIQLKAWLAPARFAKRYAHWQYFYVNGRIVKDPKITHLIRSAFPEELSLGLSPSYVIFLELPAHEVDVNVHPTKQEVRFHDTQWVSEFILQAIQRSQETLKHHSNELVQTSMPLFPPGKRLGRASALQHVVPARSQSIDIPTDTACQIVFQQFPHYLWVNYQETLFCIKTLRALRSWWPSTVQAGRANEFKQVYLLPKTLPLALTQDAQRHTLYWLGFQVQAEKHLIQVQHLPALFAEQISEQFFKALHGHLEQSPQAALDWMVGRLTVQDFFTLPNPMRLCMISDMCQKCGEGIVGMTDAHLAAFFSDKELVE